MDGPQGYWGPLAELALPYMEYQQRYGATREDMATVVVEARRAGSSIAWSHWAGKPLTVDDYMEARMIAEPLSVLDCDLPVTGVGAFVLTSAERARDLPQPAGLRGRLRPGPLPAPQRPRALVTLDEIMEGGRPAVANLWESSGLDPGRRRRTPALRRVLALRLLLAGGPRLLPGGEAHRFVQDGAITAGSGRPFLSGGGALGNGRMHGMPQMLECYLQLSGRAGDRQLDRADVGLACQATPNFGGAVLYTSSPPT